MERDVTDFFYNFDFMDTDIWFEEISNSQIVLKVLHLAATDKWFPSSVAAEKNQNIDCYLVFKEPREYRREITLYNDDGSLGKNIQDKKEFTGKGVLPRREEFSLIGRSISPMGWIFNCEIIASCCFLVEI